MSFVDIGGSFARVDAGSTFVGCPGAPGWTITGPVCCALTKHTNAHTIKNEPNQTLIIASIYLGNLDSNLTTPGVSSRNVAKNPLPAEYAKGREKENSNMSCLRLQPEVYGHRRNGFSQTL